MNEKSKQGESLTTFVLEVFRLNGALLDAGNEITKPHGLTSARWQVMGAIELADQPLTVSQIARRMGLTRQGVQRIVNDLVKLEMVQTAENMDHKRAPLISISDKGENALIEIDKAQTAWINDLAKGINNDHITGALELLNLVRERLE